MLTDLCNFSNFQNFKLSKIIMVSKKKIYHHLILFLKKIVYFFTINLTTSICPLLLFKLWLNWASISLIALGTPAIWSGFWLIALDLPSSEKMGNMVKHSFISCLIFAWFTWPVICFNSWFFENYQKNQFLTIFFIKNWLHSINVDIVIQWVASASDAVLEHALVAGSFRSALDVDAGEWRPGAGRHVQAAVLQ